MNPKVAKYIGACWERMVVNIHVCSEVTWGGLQSLERGQIHTHGQEVGGYSGQSTEGVWISEVQLVLNLNKVCFLPTSV